METSDVLFEDALETVLRRTLELVVLKTVCILLVSSFQHLCTTCDRWLYECFATTELFQCAGAFELSFVLLEGLVNYFPFFNLDNEHVNVLFL